MENPARAKADVLLIGAGLSNCLLAWFLRQRQPHLKVHLFEKGAGVSPGRTWSFHESDLGPLFQIVKPFVSKAWPGYHVSFPHLQREINSRYCSIQPESLQQKVVEVLGNHIHFNAEVERFGPSEVVLKDGTQFTAPCVIDGRGLNESSSPSGYQKFLGLHLRLRSRHGLLRPRLMDAQVPQKDGFRFMYCLPWNEREVLIEDTYYSDNSLLDTALLENEVLRYAGKQGWEIESIVGREHGILPIPFTMSTKASEDAAPNPGTPQVGMRGGLFHPVTGYSLPEAVSVADKISLLSNISSERVRDLLKNYRQSRSWQNRYFCFLNRLMFQAAVGEKRYRIFERFYALPLPLIESFYRGHLSSYQQLRILSGKPPVPLNPALRCLLQGGL